MNQADDRNQINSQSRVQTQGAPNTQQANPISVGVGKEHEAKTVTPTDAIQPVVSEIELPKEVEKAGVTFQKETMEIPPDVQKLGVKHAGPTTPLTDTNVLTQVTLPISDPQVVAGLHAQITSAFLWLAVWCIKKLKKAHLALKIIHGKIVRVRTQN